LTFDFQSRLNTGGPAINHFDGHLLFELGVRPLGKENLPHAADTQGAQYAIRPDAVSFHAQSMHLDAGEPQSSAALAAGCCLRV
jgi:hypothetical protein